MLHAVDISVALVFSILLSVTKIGTNGVDMHIVTSGSVDVTQLPFILVVL